MKAFLLAATVLSLIVAGYSTAAGHAQAGRPDCPCGLLNVSENGEPLAVREYADGHTQAVITLQSDNAIRITRTLRGYELVVSYTGGTSHTFVGVSVDTHVPTASVVWRRPAIGSRP